MQRKTRQPQSTSSGNKKATHRIITESINIEGIEYERKIFIPLESKLTRFLKKLNKKPRAPDMSIGK